MRKVIATDLDGTLFYPRRKIGMIPWRNLKFCRKLINDGNELVLVTGRSHFYTMLVEEKIESSLDVIGMNGAFIIVDGQIKDEHFLDKEVLELYKDITTRFNILGCMIMSKRYPLLITGPHFNWVKRLFYRIYYWTQGVYAEKFLLSRSLFQKELRSGRVYKLMFFFGLGKDGHEKANKANKYIREHYGDSFEASWSHLFIEITPKGCSKGESLKKYQKYKGVSDENIYVVGDSGNDISMFKEYYENSFCMKHSSPAVKKYAKHILRRFYDLQAYL